MKTGAIRKGMLHILLLLLCFFLANPSSAAVHGNNERTDINDAAYSERQGGVMQLQSSFDNTAQIAVTGTCDYDAAFEILALVNQARTAEGLSPLVMNESLLETAMLRAAECSVYYSHTRPNGQSCFTAFDLRYSGAGENIAAGYTSASHVMDGWMNSQGHRDNIMKARFTDIGIGCFYQDNTLYWCQVFASGCISREAEVRTNETRTFVTSALADNLDLRISAASTTLNAGETTRLIISTCNPGFSYYSTILDSHTFSFESSNEAVVKVSSSGDVTALAGGSATVTATLGNGFPSLSKDFSVKGSGELPGDVDGDGKITTRDAIIILKVIASKTLDTFSAAQISAGDVSHDGKINTRDAIIILQAIASKTTDQL